MSNCVEYCSKKFNIQGLTRLKEDSCYKQTRQLYSQKPGGYNTRNFHDCACEAPYTKELSLQQPATNYRDGYGWAGQFGSKIDNDTSIHVWMLRMRGHRC